MPDTAGLAPGLVGHLPAAKASEALGRGWEGEEENGAEDEAASLLPDTI